MLALADVAVAGGALALAAVAGGTSGLGGTAALGLVLVVLVGKVQGLYDRDQLLIRKSTIDEAPDLARRATLCTLLLWLVDDRIFGGAATDLQILTLWTSLVGGSLVGRRLARASALRTTPGERCLFVGDAASYARLGEKLDDDRVNASLVGRMSGRRAARYGATTAAEDLGESLRATRADRIIIEPQAMPSEDMLDFVRAAESAGVRVSLLPRVLDVVGSSVVLDHLKGMTLLGVRPFGLCRSSSVAKRAIDVAVAVGLLLAVAPALALIALAIRLNSTGPILFRQTRVGRDGRRFEIRKFRTMCTDAERRKPGLRAENETEGLFKIAEDPRVTRVGRVLRRTSLDELPQLLNVVRGDMSLVGPRPLVVDEDEQITGWDRRRLDLTPGMTGPWQILGSARVPLHEMVKIDYLYVACWSPWQDAKIMLRTIPYMLARRGV